MSILNVKSFLLTGLLIPGILFCKEIPLTVIQTSDIHGSVTHYRLAKTMELVRCSTENAGGYDKSIRIDCGDLIQGSFSMTFPVMRQAMVETLNQLRYDVFVPGNHDFEFGAAELSARIRQFNGKTAAANLSWQGTPVVPWVLLQRNGLKIAVIGLAYHAVPSLLTGKEGTAVHSFSVRNSLAKIMPEVLRAKPEIILLAIHAGEHTRPDRNYTLTDIVREYPQIDLVLSAHSHQPEPGKALGYSWRMQAPALAQGIAEAQIIYDDVKHKITSLKTRVIPISEKIPPHSEVAAMLAPIQRHVNKIGRQRIGYLPFDLAPLRKGEKENNLTRLFGSAIISATAADSVFYGTNSRFRKNKGPITEYELFLLSPYEDHIGIVSLPSSEINHVLTEQLHFLRKGFFQAPYGLKFNIKHGKAAIEGRNTQRCAFSTFSLSGASWRFPVLKKISEKYPVQYSSETVRTMLREHIRKQYSVKK